MSNTTPMKIKIGPPPVGLDDEPDDVLQGTRPSFAVIIQPSKGQWGIRYQRKDWFYQDSEGNNIPSFEVVIIKSRENLSNKFYAKWEGNTKKPPDCFASDGVTPDDRVPVKQHPTCAGCPQKVMGSALTGTGQPTTACRNERKLAVIPFMHFSDRKYEEYGGPALYTISPTSLKNYTEYVNQVKALGHKAFSVITRMRFDPTTKHQKIIFSVHRALSQDEYDLVKELRHDPRTARVLDEEPETPIIEEDDDDIVVQPTVQAKTVTAQPPTPPAPKATTPKAPPPPRPGGFAVNTVTQQSVTSALNQPAPRPPQVRPMQQVPPIEDVEIEQEEILDEEVVSDSLDEGLDDELKRLLNPGS